MTRLLRINIWRNNQRRARLAPPLTCAVAFCLAACAQTGAPVGSAASPSGSGRFLQQTDVTLSSLSVQMNLPNPDTCTLVLIGLRKSAREEFLKGATRDQAAQVEGLLDRMYKCSVDDRSSLLPFRATLRIRSNGLLVDVYATSIEQCNQAVSAEAAVIESVAGCAKFGK